MDLSALNTPTAQLIGTFLTLLYFHRQSNAEIRAMRQENATDRQRTDERFSKIDDRFVKSDERWLNTERQILDIMYELDMRKRPKSEKPKSGTGAYTVGESLVREMHSEKLKKKHK